MPAWRVSRAAELCAKTAATFRREGWRGVRRKTLEKFRHSARRLAFRPYVIRRSICGEVLPFLIGDLFGEDWYGPRHAPWPELEWIKSRGIRAEDVVVDCGANHGFSSLLFARWTGARGRVFAFEPSPHNLEILRANVRLNNAQNIIVRPVAVGEQAGVVRISTHPNASVVPQGARRDTPGYEVPVVRLDDEFPSGRVDFIKIDVEGFEVPVLRGARRLLGQRPALALELHGCMYPRPINELEQLFGLLPLPQYEAEIQLEVDGPLTAFNPRVHTPARLAREHVVHLFCRPRAGSG